MNVRATSQAPPLRRVDRTVIGRLDHVQDGLFQGLVGDSSPYLLRVIWPEGDQESEDPPHDGPSRRAVGAIS